MSEHGSVESERVEVENEAFRTQVTTGLRKLLAGRPGFWPLGGPKGVVKDW